MSNYAEQAAAHKANRGFRPPEGEYGLRLKEWSFPVSKSVKNMGKPYFKLDFKVTSAPDADTLAKFQNGNKKITVRFFPFASYSFGDFLLFIQGLGADLSAIRSYEDDPNMEDFKNILDVAEKQSADARGKIRHQKDDDSNYNVDLFDIEPVFGATPTPVQQPAQQPVPVQQPVQPAPVAAPPVVEQPVATQPASVQQPAPVATPAPAPAPVQQPVVPATQAAPATPATW